MAEIDSLNSMTFAGIQNATNPALKNKKAEKTNETKKSSFSQLLKSKTSENTFYSIGLPPEINNMSLEDAAIFLKDAVDISGNNLSEDFSDENLEQFKKSIRQFLIFMEKNNFEVTTTNKTDRRRRPVIASPLFNFGTHTAPTVISKKTTMTVLSKKLDELTWETLEQQKRNGNLDLLAKINDIKGLIVDLMSS